MYSPHIPPPYSNSSMKYHASDHLLSPTFKPVKYHTCHYYFVTFPFTLQAP